MESDENHRAKSGVYQGCGAGGEVFHLNLRGFRDLRKTGYKQYHRYLVAGCIDALRDESRVPQGPLPETAFEICELRKRYQHWSANQ